MSRTKKGKGKKDRARPKIKKKGKKVNICGRPDRNVKEPKIPARTPGFEKQSPKSMAREETGGEEKRGGGGEVKNNQFRPGRLLGRSGEKKYGKEGRKRRRSVHW